MRRLYGLMLRYPEPGSVKSRLAQDIGAAAAAACYRSIAERVIRATAPAGDEYHRILFFDPAHEQSRFSAWLPGTGLMPQRGADLGERMRSVIRDLLDLGADTAVITGCDIPDLDRTVLLDAFSALDTSDVVIGPSEDGGYYLIGMKDDRPDLFSGIAWGTADVFRETCEAIGRSGLKHAMVRTLRDVDRVTDLRIS